MEVYILDSLLRRIDVVDKFQSAIWTDRYADLGDFELQLHSTRENRQRFGRGTLLACNKSYSVMMVETIEDTTDDDGQNRITVKGHSLELILKDRVAKDTQGDTTTDPSWVLGGTPGDIARQVFTEICINGRLDIRDIIPFMQAGNLLPSGNIPEPSEIVITAVEPRPVYDVIRDICVLYDLGFRLLRNFDTSQLYFEIYTGSDRTTRQTTLPAVVFSLENDNLKKTTSFESIQDTKNVAYVYSDFGSLVVYGDNVDPEVDGFDRRVLLVQASNIAEDTPDIPGVLLQQGKEALSKARAFSAFDGELSSVGQFLYGVDYYMGDIVEMRDKDGVISYKRVTEQIFVHDREGERSYPTLTMNMFIALNTWLSQRPSVVWEDMTDETWATS